MATSARAFLDTNLLVYLFDADAPAKQSAMQHLVAARGGGGDLVISAQVLQEFFVAGNRSPSRTSALILGRADRLRRAGRRLPRAAQ